MKRSIGLELINETAEITSKNIKIDELIKKHQLDSYEYGIILRDETDVDFFKQFLIENEVFEAEFSLFTLNTPEKKQVFTDFGFVSQEKRCYLYEELVIPFSASGNNEKDVARALEQMDEHLIAIDRAQTNTIYFVERYHQQLIEGIADAYNINVIFYL